MPEEINYKEIYQRLVDRYPRIAEELRYSDPILDNLQMLSVYTLFCTIKGVFHMNLPDNDKSNTRALFVAVFVKVFDPAYFEYRVTLRRGLRKKMACLLNCHETQISHILSSVRTYMKAYKAFRNEVDYIHGIVKSELDGIQEEKEAKLEREPA